MSDLKLFTDGVETYVALSPEHAVELWEANTGEKRNGDDHDPFVERVSDKPIKIMLDDERGEVTQTTQKWIEENGEGFLCSTEY